MLKPYIKKILKHPKFVEFLSWLIAKYMVFVYKTSSWEYRGEEAVKAYWDAGKPVICSFWHARLGMTVFAWRSKIPFHMVISAHKDGKIISGAVGHLGIKTIAGSSSKGGAEAIRNILKVLKASQAIGITPDGPRGPRFSVNPGIVNIARKAGVDIIPVSFATSRRLVWSSWDKMIVPLPFSKGVIAWGTPIQVAKEADIEATCRLVHQGLCNVTDLADTACGCEIVR